MVEVPEASSRKVLEGFGGFRRMRRFRRWVPEGSERLVPEGLGRFRRVPESSGACWCRFRRQEQPCDCFDHGDNIVHMGKNTAQKGANVVKDGTRHKDVYATVESLFFNSVIF